MENGKENNNLQKHTNLAYLREVANGSNSFIIEMLGIFIEQTPPALNRIEEAMKNQDWKSLRFAVHKIKPSIMFTGLSEIINDVPLLENYAAEESNLDAIPTLVYKIKRVCGEAIIELQEELKKLQ